MKPKKPSPKVLLSSCAELCEEDGTDPREFFRAGKREQKIDRKTLQLCRQVAETLNYVLSGDCRDALLQSLQVVSVVPSPDASQLLATLCPAVRTDQPVDHRDVQERLAIAAGRLRCEVAAAVTRKRAPKLIFTVVNDPAGPGVPA